MLLNYANTVIFDKIKTNGVYTKLYQKLRTFYGIKISVIEKKLQPLENQICRYIKILKKSLIIR